MMISPPHGPDEAMLLTLAKVLEGLLMYKYQQMATRLLQEFSITISKGKGRIYKYTKMKHGLKLDWMWFLLSMQHIMMDLVTTLMVP
jgi:uncharacterized membrane protein